MLTFIFIVTLLVIAWSVKAAGITPLKGENNAPEIQEPKGKKIQEGLPKPKVCSVTYEYRYEKLGMTERLGGQMICRWVAAERGVIFAASPWFTDRYTTLVELRKSVPLIGGYLMPSLPKQQEYIDKTQNVSATNYWKLIELLEKHGWQCNYSSDGTANSMVQAKLPTTEPVRPGQMDPGFKLS